MQKRRTVFLAFLALAALLCGCAQQGEAHIEESKVTILMPQPETTVPTTQPETVAEENWEDTPTDRAFRKTLQFIHDELYWPNSQPNGERIELWEPGTIEDEKFAVIDVDGDGEKELLVSIANTYMAGMCEVIYGYDAASDSVRIEADVFTSTTHYADMLKVEASHNHGYAGDVLWPYTVMTYDAEWDTYKVAYIVDAWSRELSETDYEGNPYPEDIDTGHDGYVYLIAENDEQRILNQADFEKWEAELFADKEPLTIPWQKLTAENIGLAG